MTASPAFRYSHTTRDNVLVQDLSDWSGQLDGIDRVQQEWLDLGRPSFVTAAVTEFDPNVFTASTQHHLVREWSENASQVGIERIGFVVSGARNPDGGLPVNVPQDVQMFVSLDQALEWARD
jgi:hypothetical protein